MAANRKLIGTLFDILKKAAPISPGDSQAVTQARKQAIEKLTTAGADAAFWQYEPNLEQLPADALAAITRHYVGLYSIRKAWQEAIKAEASLRELAEQRADAVRRLGPVNSYVAGIDQAEPAKRKHADEVKLEASKRTKAFIDAK
jgi:hypothetical protein